MTRRPRRRRRCHRFHANFWSFSSLTRVFPLFFARRAHYSVHATKSPCFQSEEKKTSLTTHHANAVLAMEHRRSLHWPLCCVCIRCLHFILILFFTFPKQFTHRMILHNFDLSYVIKHMVRKQMSCFRCHNHRAACFHWIRPFFCACVCVCVFRWSLYRSKNSLLNHYRCVFIPMTDEYHLRHDGSLLFSEDAIQH